MAHELLPSLQMNKLLPVLTEESYERVRPDLKWV